MEKYGIINRKQKVGQRMNKITKNLLKALSYRSTELDVETVRKITDLKKLDPIRILARKLDLEIYNEGYKIPVRLYFSSKEMEAEGENYRGKVLLFLHGGGWVNESIETYERICMQLAISTRQMVIAVEYRRAPEYKFPIPLLDCYAAARALFQGEILKYVEPQDITVLGDSAGGNLTAALILLAKQRKEFMPQRQILVYPALWNDYTETSPFQSVKENGTDYLLTTEKMETYLNLYQADPEDRNNYLFAPLLYDRLEQMPRTLILTAEFDPLRDEGEEYGRKLKEAGNEVEVRRIAGAIHGYFALGIKYIHVKESLDVICDFLGVSRT